MHNTAGKVWKKISGASCLLSGLGVYTYAVVPQEGNLLASLFPNGIGERISGYKSDTPEGEVQLAWTNEGRRYFNQCQKFGKWVADVMYTPKPFDALIALRGKTNRSFVLDAVRV